MDLQGTSSTRPQHNKPLRERPPQTRQTPFSMATLPLHLIRQRVGAWSMEISYIQSCIIMMVKMVLFIL